MPTIRISARSEPQLTTALGKYRSELAEIIDPIRSEAKFAGVSAVAYVPKDLLEEYEITQQSQQRIKSYSDGATRLFGREIPHTHLRVIASALALRRDDLASRLEAIEADPLTPKEAHSPLRDEIQRIDCEIEDFWGQFGYSSWLPKLRARREMKLGLSYPGDVRLETVIQDGEGQTTEFTDSFPDQAHELAKEIAAFGTSNPGMIVLGVRNNGVPIGLKKMRSPANRDRLRTRIEGVSSNAIIPSLPVRVRFDVIRRHTIAVIEVPKGPEPVYYTKNGVPYIRHGSLSRPALPQEVNELVKRYLERQSA